MPPHNLEAETAALGAVLVDPKALATIAKVVKPEDFYHDSHRIVLEAMLELQQKMQAVDILTIANLLEEKGVLDKIGGSGYLAAMYNQTATASNARHYAEIVKKLSIARKIIVASYKIREIGEDVTKDPKKSLSEAAKVILGINAQSSHESHGTKEILKEYDTLREQYTDAAMHGKSILGHTTGFPEIDEMTQGFREHHIWMIGGYTSVGKTYFALNLVRWMLEQEKRIVFYSLEMSKVDIVSRLMAILTNMPPQYILKGLIKPEEQGIYDAAKAFLEQANLTIYSETHDLDQIKLSMIEESMREPVGLFVLDYVQLVTRTGIEYDDMRAAATEFQSLMGELKTPMVMLTQISNEAAKNPKSWTSGAKGASNLIQAADYYIELWPNETDHELYLKHLKDGVPVRVLGRVKKNRHGRTGAVNLFFSSYTGVFEEDKNWV